jgi:hypothetical protein
MNESDSDYDNNDYNNEENNEENNDENDYDDNQGYNQEYNQEEIHDENYYEQILNQVGNILINHPDNNNTFLNQQYSSHLLKQHFTVSEYIINDEKVKNALTLINNLYNIKIKNRQINKNWFLGNEIKITQRNQQNDLSGYIIQMITEQSINMCSILESVFTEQNDKTKINNIGVLIQDWINIMEYIDGGYHLNIENINDFNTLILWLFIMCSDIKFIPTMMTHLGTDNLFSIEFLQRKANNISIMIMSIWNKNIRDIIIEHIGKTLYTTLLNEEINLSTDISMTLIEISVTCGTFYDMIKDDVIDMDVINYKENNTIMHLLYETINCYLRKKRTINQNFRKLRIYDNPNISDIPQHYLNKFEELKYIKNDKNMTPLTSLLFGYYFVNDHVYCNTHLMEFMRIYKLDNNIEKITLHSFYPYELIYLYLGYLGYKDNVQTLCDENVVVRQVYYNYFLDYMWLHAKSSNNTLKDMYINLKNILVKHYDIIKLFSQEQDRNIILRLIKENYDISNLVVIIMISENINIISGLEAFITLEEYNNIIDKLISNCNIHNQIDKKIIIKLIEPLIGMTHNYNDKLFEIYIKNHLERRISENFNTILDKYYMIDTDRDNTIRMIVDYICQNNIRGDMTIHDIFSKYMNNIGNILTSNKFYKLFQIVPHIQKLILESPLIKIEVKYGDSTESETRITDIIDVLDEGYTYEQNDIENYKITNKHRLNTCLHKFIEDDDFNLFCNIFKIDDEYINSNNIKDKYVELLIEGNIDKQNLLGFLKKFKYTHHDYEENINNIKKIIKKNRDVDIIFAEHLISEGLLDSDLVKSYFNKFKYIYKPLENLMEDIIKKYVDKDDKKDILLFSISKLFSINYSYEQISNYIETYPVITEYILDIDLTNINNIPHIIKYYNNVNNIEILNLFCIEYTRTFTETNLLSANDKISILYKLRDKISSDTICIILDKINNSDDNIIQENICKFADLCRTYDIPIKDNLISKYPELIHISGKANVDSVLNSCLEDYDKFNKIIKFQPRSDKIEKKLLKLTKENDMSLYIECLIEFKSKLNKIDKKLILESVLDDMSLLKYILNNDKIKTQLFDSNKDICKLVDIRGNYIISSLDIDIHEYIDLYEISDLTILNNFGSPRLFSFLNSQNNIKYFIQKFGLNNLTKIKSNRNENIYDKMILQGIFDDIPESYILSDKNVLNIIKQCPTEYVSKLLSSLNKEQFEKLIDVRDNDSNNILYYLIKIHPNLFKELVKSNKITKNMFVNNNQNETLIMKLIKDSKLYDMESIIIWINNNLKLDVSDYYANYTDGSVLSYSLKYNQDLINIFSSSDIIKSCINIYDRCDIICPYSENSLAKNVSMNILYLSSIFNDKILDKIMKSDKKTVNRLFKDKLVTDNFEHNLLTIALFNNPESVQKLLSYNLCDNVYIKNTEQMIEGFEKIIEIQPASWYYLQQNLKNRSYPVKLNLEEHWYGYNYKRNLTPENIKNVTHYILDKQEVGDKTNMCEICDTFKRKVVFTKCRHKVCITCAVHSDKCGNCRVKLSDTDKILI